MKEASAAEPGGPAASSTAAVAALAGKAQLGKATPPVPEQAVGSVRADIEEIKERAHR